MNFFKRDRKHIFITCTPKSGSTYLLQLLSSMLGYDIKIFIAAFDRTEQDVFEEAILKWKNKNTVTHQHTRCTSNTRRILDKHHIKPLILTRNLFDSVISMRNHMINEPDHSWWPMAYVDHNFYALSIEEQHDFVIDLIVPWYINFYVSWKRHPENDKLLWISYDELMNDKLGTLKLIFDYYGIKLKIDEAELLKHEANIEGKTRKTKPSASNEKLTLTSQQKSRIISLTRFYKDIDFTKMEL